MRTRSRRSPPRRRLGALAAALALSVGLADLVAAPVLLPAPPGAASVTRASVPVLRGLNNRPASLPAGPVVAEAFAPWCGHCATTAKWLDAQFAAQARRAGATLVLVDTSHRGGLGIAAKAPTLASIQATARDGSRAPLRSNAAIDAALQSFLAHYQLSDLPAYFVPLGTDPPADWQVTGFPTFVALDARHHVVATESGFLTAAQFEAWLRRAAAHWAPAADRLRPP